MPSSFPFRDLIERSPDLIAVHQGEHMMYANPALVRHLGYADAKEVVGRAVKDFVHPDDWAGSAERIRAVVGRQEAALPAVVRYFHADGSVGIAEVVSVPVEIDGVQAMVAFGRDVTERKALEQRLIEAELMASIGVLAAAVNHEINNPLQYLIFAQQALALEIDELGRASSRDDVAVHLPRLRELSNELAEGMQRVRTVARDFRALTRVREDAIEPVDMCAVISSASRIAEAEVRHRTKLKLDLERVPRVRANAGRIGQVIVNLMINAAQAVPDAGEQEIRVSTRSSGRDVIVDVEDSGPGIDRSIAGRIFEPFFTTKPSGKGTGLGLSICHGIVEGFGGKIELLKSELGGALFRVRLPAAT
jgi:PAS domain S-box-containing protein